MFLTRAGACPSSPSWLADSSMLLQHTASAKIALVPIKSSSTDFRISKSKAAKEGLKRRTWPFHSADGNEFRASKSVVKVPPSRCSAVFAKDGAGCLPGG